MTEQELGTLERMAKAKVAEPKSVLALVAEVRRLRGLVEQAFFEAGSLNGPGVNAWEWENSDARKALGEA
jgi:hypothetical protein